MRSVWKGVWSFGRVGLGWKGEGCVVWGREGEEGMEEGTYDDKGEDDLEVCGTYKSGCWYSVFTPWLGKGGEIQSALSLTSLSAVCR